MTQIIDSIEKIPLLPEAIFTIGFFDGFHLGHRKIISTMLEIKQKRQIPIIVFTFANHPFSILKPDSVPRFISPLSYREEFLLSLNAIDYIVLQSFTINFSLISAENFLTKILERIKKPVIVLGEHSRFGKNNKGNATLVQTYHEKKIVEFINIPPLYYEKKRISSTFIRSLIHKGDFPTVQKLLDRPFFCEGIVEKGKSIGKTIGFPTANFFLPDYQVCPAFGVYQTTTEIEGASFRSLTYISNTRLNEQEKNPLVETHIIDFEKDIYNKKIRVFFLKRIRPPKFFVSPEDLRKQILRDKKVWEKGI